MIMPQKGQIGDKSICIVNINDIIFEKNCMNRNDCLFVCTYFLLHKEYVTLKIGDLRIL